MAIRNKLTIDGSGKVSPRSGCHGYLGANSPRRRLEEGQNVHNVSELWEFTHSQVAAERNP
jgi:hypothetical protein